MPDELSPSAAITRLRRARNQLLLSQIAVLDLAQLSDTEAARLDFPENRARRLSESLGRPDLPLDTSLNLFALTEEIFKARDIRRAREQASKKKDGSTSDSVPTPKAADAGDADRQESDDESPVPDAETAAIKNLASAIESAGLPPRALVNTLTTCIKILAEKPRSGLMLESLLLSSVAQFEVFVSRMITTSLQYDPTPLKESDKKYTFSDIAGLGSIRNFQKSVVDSYVDSLMYDGMSAWMKFLARVSRTDTAWVSDLLAEVVMRRNVHVHAGGRASGQYISALGKMAAAVSIGDELPVTAAYLEDALNRMSRACIVLTQAATFAVCTSKRGKASESSLDPDIGLVESSFDLLAAGRWPAVAPLSEQLETIVAQASTRERIRVNSFHAKKMWEGVDSVRAEIKAWDVSAADDELRLAKYCLLDDVDGAKTLFEKLTASGVMSVLELATWPILEPLRVALEADAAVEEERGRTSD